MIQHPDFPRPTPENHQITSPPSADYNCIAWTAHDSSRWWQPDTYWPIAPAPDDYGIGVLEQAFVALGYEDCISSDLEPAFERIALYGSFARYTHAARQLPDGKWTSKLGSGEDIEHDTPHCVGGGIYGEVAQFMRRPISRTG